MAGTVVVTKSETRSVKVLILSWTSDASGDVSGTTGSMSGEILKIVTDPDGTDAPTANYDVVLNDTHAVDVALGLLANRHTSNNETVYPRQEITLAVNSYAVPIFVDGTVEAVVSNAGNVKKGVISIYYR